jgi:hypothetical protein
MAEAQLRERRRKRRMMERRKMSMKRERIGDIE